MHTDVARQRDSDALTGEAKIMLDTMRLLQGDGGEVETQARLAMWESESLRTKALALRDQLRCLRRQIRNMRLERGD